VSERVSTHPIRELSPEGTAVLDRVRAISLALSGAVEKLAWGTATFRAGDRMFAHFNDNHHNDGRIAVWCAAPPGAQETLIDAAPGRFFRPPYVGHKGWVGIDLGPEVDWDEVAWVLENACRSVASRKLLAGLEDTRTN
jgi:hypothetical protein